MMKTKDVQPKRKLFLLKYFLKLIVSFIFKESLLDNVELNTPLPPSK